MAEVPGLFKAAGVRDAVLVLRDKVDAEGAVVASCSLNGMSEASRSSSELDAKGTKLVEEPRSEALVVISSGSANKRGELVRDSGDSGGQPQTATVWASTSTLVCTLLGRERRERAESDAMASALGVCSPAGSMVVAEGIATRA